MFSLRNIFYGTFVLLILVILAEVGFYFYIQRNGFQTAQEAVPSPVVPPKKDEITPLPTRPKNLVPAVHPEVMKSLAKMVASSESSTSHLFLTFEFNSQVEEVYPEGKRVGDVQFPYGLRFSTGDYLAGQRKVDKMRVFIDGKPASIKDISVGDTLRIREFFDVSKPLNTLEGLDDVIIEIER